MVIHPAGLEAKDDCAGKGQQQIIRPDQLVFFFFFVSV
jgi:hypothetical protein